MIENAGGKFNVGASGSGEVRIEINGHFIAYNQFRNEFYGFYVAPLDANGDVGKYRPVRFSEVLSLIAPAVKK